MSAFSLSSPDPLRAALEAALEEDPDDLATHSAYADLLQESDDPVEQARGELIRVQLALENESLPGAERRRLQGREAELLTFHERTWLGSMAGWFFESEEALSGYRREHNKVNRLRWARGWPEELYLWYLGLDKARSLARSPILRLLRRLHIEHEGFENEYEAQPEDGIPEDSEYPLLYPLASALFLLGLRSLTLGEIEDFEDDTYNSEASGEGLVPLLVRTTRLEELVLFAHSLDLHQLFSLPNLTRLRTLIVYHVHDFYPLDVLANNPALANLTTLRLHPAHAPDVSSLPRAQVRALLNSPHLPSLTHLHLHASDLGDEGCEAIVESGILKRLKVLDLRFGCIQDEGARILAGCPDVRNLELLSLASNELSEEGTRILQGLGIRVRTENQSRPGSNEYLWSGDME